MAAFGLFHIVFTNLETHLAVAAFRMCKPKDPDLTFGEVFQRRFSDKLKLFEEELERFGSDHTNAVAVRLYAQNISILRQTCGVIKELAAWRNERVHSRVFLTEHGYELYGSKTEKRLEMSYAHIEAKRQEAIKAICDIEGCVGELAQVTKWEAEFDKLFSGLRDDADSDAFKEV